MHLVMNALPRASARRVATSARVKRSNRSAAKPAAMMPLEGNNVVTPAPAKANAANRDSPANPANRDSSSTRRSFSAT